MFYTKEIIQKLKTDTVLRLKVCLELKITEQSVHNAIKRKSKSILHISAVNVIKEHTGLSEEEIFEKEKAIK